MTKKHEYTLTFFVGKNGEKEISENIDCDWWNYVGAEDGLPIIYCLSENKDSCEGFPAGNLRKIKHNFGVQEIMNHEPYTKEEKPEGYN